MADNVGPSLTLLQKHFGPSFMTKKRKKDIELPSSGNLSDVDPRILKKIDEGSPADKIKFGHKMFQHLTKKK